MKMKLFIILLLFSIFSLSNAQTKADSSNIFGDHSLQFRVYDFISLSSFKGTLLSYKYHINDESAHRFSASIRYKKYNAEETIERTHTDSALLDQNRDHNYAYVEIMAEYIKYFNSRNEVKLFMGIGPRISFNLNNYDTDDVSGYGYSFGKTNKNDLYEIGLTSSFGVEWFFTRNMSLSAEYGLNLMYRSRKNSFESEVISGSTDETTFRFTGNNINFGISIFFNYWYMNKLKEINGHLTISINF